jgi:hypothetical protein
LSLIVIARGAILSSERERLRRVQSPLCEPDLDLEGDEHLDHGRRDDGLVLVDPHVAIATEGSDAELSLAACAIEERGDRFSACGHPV